MGDPSQHGTEGAAGVVLAKLAEELPAGADMERDSSRIAEVEVTGGHAREVGVEFRGITLLEFGGRGFAKFVQRKEDAALKNSFAFKPCESGVVKLADEALFPAGPAGFVSRAAVRSRVKIEGVEPLAAADDAGEAADDFRIVEVAGGGGLPEEEVVIDEEEERLAALVDDLQAAANLVGEFGAGVGVMFRTVRFA